MKNNNSENNPKTHESEVEMRVVKKPLPFWKSKQMKGIILILCFILFAVVLYSCAPSWFAPTLQAAVDPTNKQNALIMGSTTGNIINGVQIQLFMNSTPTSLLNVSPNGSYSTTITNLKPGTYIFEAQAITTDDNRSALSKPATVSIVDAPIPTPTPTAIPTLPPTSIPTASPTAVPTATPLVIITPTLADIISGTYYYSADILNFSGTTTAKQTVKLYDGNTSIGNAVANEDGKWAIKLDKELTIGSHFLQLGLFDNDGKELARSQIIRIIIATSLTVQIEPGGIITISSNVTNSGTLSGTAHPSLTVKISDSNALVITTVVDALGTWQWLLPTSTVTGTHSYQFIQLDPSSKEIGNPLKRTITISFLPLPDSGADLTSVNLTASGLIILELLILSVLKISSRFAKRS